MYSYPGMKDRGNNVGWNGLNKQKEDKAGEIVKLEKSGANSGESLTVTEAMSRSLPSSLPALGEPHPSFLTLSHATLPDN